MEAKAQTGVAGSRARAVPGQNRQQDGTPGPGAPQHEIPSASQSAQGDTPGPDPLTVRSSLLS